VVWNTLFYILSKDEQHVCDFLSHPYFFSPLIIQKNFPDNVSVTLVWEAQGCDDAAVLQMSSRRQAII